MPAPYDTIADWYENEFLSDRSDDGLPMSDPIGVDGCLCEMLGQGVGVCLEIGCGTGHTLHGFVGWAGRPSASTSRPGCYDTLAPGFRSRRPMASVSRSGTPRSRA